MPDTPKPKNLPKGTIWRDKVRTDIPGSIWLANVGYGALPPETEAYFRAALEAHGGKDATVSVLLHDRLLDVVERSEAGSGLGLPECRLVSGRGGWMGEGRAAGRRQPALCGGLKTAIKPGKDEF